MGWQAWAGGITGGLVVTGVGLWLKAREYQAQVDAVKKADQGGGASTALVVDSLAARVMALKQGLVAEATLITAEIAKKTADDVIAREFRLDAATIARMTRAMDSKGVSTVKKIVGSPVAQFAKKILG